MVRPFVPLDKAIQDEIRNRYLAGEKYIVIEAEVGVSKDTVARYAHKFNLPMRAGVRRITRLHPVTIEEIRRRYLAGETYNQIKSALGIANTSLQRYTRDLPRRNPRGRFSDARGKSKTGNQQTAEPV